MNFVIQTQASTDVAIDLEEAFALLKQVHAVETAPPLELNEKKFYYFEIDGNCDINGLISNLMELPGIESAYNKPAEDLPSM
jgi:hypothetical protein